MVSNSKMHRLSTRTIKMTVDIVHISYVITKCVWFS